MSFIDYYKTLEIGPNATKDDIKKAYRKLARKFHPDLSPNDSAANLNFQRINEANNVLSDPMKRKKYDQYGKDWEHVDKANRAQSSYQRTSRGPQGGGDFSDFFESMFGGNGRQGKFRGEDLQTTLHVSLLDAFKTHKQTLNINGKSIRITIPAGIENEQIIKIAKHGGAGHNGGSNGDLFITIMVGTHPDFRRLGKDLHAKVTLDLYSAILGGELTIDTLDGKVKLQVKPETQNGTQVKLKGKGFPVYKKEGLYGDLYVSYTVKTPTNLSDKQKELFIELSKL
jgi:curved DNA-binding protein